MSKARDLSKLAINSAIINNSTIGATTASTAKFTNVAINGATSGAATLVVPAVAGTPTITLPTVTGTLPTVDNVNSWTKTQSAPQVALTSTSAHIATNCALGNNFSHTMTESTTLDNPTNIVAGTAYTWTITQHASSAKTLALGSYFKTADGAAFAGISTTVNSVNTIYGFAKTATLIDVNIIKNGVS